MSPLGAELRARYAGIEARHGGLLAGDPRRAWTTGGLFGAAATLLVFGMWYLGLTPVRLWDGSGRLLDIVVLMLPPDPGSWAHVRQYVDALGETLAIALLGTLAAGVLAVPFGFLAARNIVANRILHVLTRRSLDVVRSVNTLIWALIWINVVGLGPFAGALAIMSSDFGELAKLMSEAIEGANRNASEGVLSSGGGRWQAVRFGVLPQVLPLFASQLLYYFESNVRSATIIGIVGAGGIGLYLSEAVRVLEWQEVSFILLMLIVTVAIIDFISRRLRAGLIGERRG